MRTLVCSLEMRKIKNRISFLNYSIFTLNFFFILNFLLLCTKGLYKWNNFLFCFCFFVTLIMAWHLLILAVALCQLNQGKHLGQNNFQWLYNLSCVSLSCFSLVQISRECLATD